MQTVSKSPCAVQSAADSTRVTSHGCHGSSVTIGWSSRREFASHPYDADARAFESHDLGTLAQIDDATCVDRRQTDQHEYR